MIITKNSSSSTKKIIYKNKLQSLDLFHVTHDNTTYYQNFLYTYNLILCNHLLNMNKYLDLKK